MFIKYFKNNSFFVGFILISIIILIMIIGVFYVPYDANEMDITNKFAKFSTEHLLGTDQFGRDVYTRLIKGIQISFSIGVAVVTFGSIVGTIIGAFAGYYGGKIDDIIMKIIDAQMAFPGVLIAMMLIAVFGNGISNTILALSVMSLPKFARMSRSGFMKYRDAEFVKAEKVRGAGNMRIIFIHILPNILSELIVTATLTFAGAIMSEAGLSYLGLGILPPNPSLGKMLSEGQNFISIAPAYIMVTAGVLTIMVMGFNLISDGIQEVKGNR